MAAVAPVAGGVTVSTSVSIQKATAGEAISEGALIYLNSGSAYKADNSTAAKATTVGVAIAPAASGQECYYAGTLDMELLMGAAGTNKFDQNEWYVISGTSGVIEKYSDMSSGEYLTWLGYGNAARNLVWKNIVTGTTKP